MIDRPIHRGRALCALAAALFAAPMLRAETADFRAELPAPNRAASFLKSIEVEQIAGQDGDRLPFALEQALGAPASDGAPAFTVLAGHGGPAPDGLLLVPVTTDRRSTRLNSSH